MAVFLDGLLDASSTADFKAAHAVLEDIDKSTDSDLRGGIRKLNATSAGFIRAYATARKEPVGATIARALYAGVSRQIGADQTLVPESYRRAKSAPSSAELLRAFKRVTKVQPVLLVIDEFGKNLEHFAMSGSEGDPFLLQELAEMTQGADAAPLVVITMQHLSFDEYIQESSTARRREWSKVQGRFQDIPYVETPAQSRRLIAAALDQHPALREAATRWLNKHRDLLEAQGLRDIAEDAAAAIPLHPLALAVLPELCSRYGQNERTLFTFMTGPEPAALPQYLARTRWDRKSPIPLVGVDRLYDYFLESWSSMIGVADGVSRWMEIETRIRDSAGLTDEQLRALKTIGLLNLVSNGGRIRASRPLLELALATDSEDSLDVDQLLTSLVDTGIITYRAFSDEYRIWQGSDYNMRRVIDNARHNYEGASLVDLLSDAVTLEPLVAGRHSQRTGVLRIFGRRFVAATPSVDDPVDRAWDGVVFYCTQPAVETIAVEPLSDGRPAVYVIPEDVSVVREAAIEAAALSSALRSAEDESADWVARRELVERSSGAQQRLQTAIAQAWDSSAEWLVAGSGQTLDARHGLSAVLSEVADQAYPDTPCIANEMIARRELTSQGAKARRFLTDALLSHRDSEAFAITGYGPDRAVYEAVFRKTGLHRRAESGKWVLSSPTERSWKPTWRALNTAFDDAVGSRTNLTIVSARLTQPPIGLKDGIVPLLLVAGLVARSDEIALYEHGSLVLAIDDAVAERLTKNLGHFSIKNTQTRGQERSAVISSLVARLGIQNPAHAGAPTFLNVATALYRELRILPPYAQKTTSDLSEEAVLTRAAFHQAAEPDVLLFETLPTVFGLEPFDGGRRVNRAAAERYAEQLAGVIVELRECYPRLLEFIQHHLAQATATTGRQLPELKNALEADATRLDGQVLEPRLRAFVGALGRQLDDRAWLENVAMVVSEGRAPRVWTDDITGQFPLRVAELGGALRRTVALLHERLAGNLKQGYSTSRMTLTRPDGTESIELLSLTDQEKEVVDPHFDRILEVLEGTAGSRSAACRMLMARLAIEHESAQPALMTNTFGKEDQRYG
ncbi:hypothetical protein MU0083_000547 [[Mycobacterium] kokjensenii]|uniref:ATP-binding protein n=1 Tax=[Mycobacterium] kokjensenii TaxID=3064287 RepID=A0ABM9L7C4_9MYCO|nr:hypothetical protein [Mycolicibacter sp. MU0083]CAJ1493894.1 hypothetical protein MU0083_000547 [Mycolicibacter sp. MU0083]